MIWKIYSKENVSPDLTREKNIYIQSYLLLFPSTSRVALYWASPLLARMYTHTQSHASSCLRVFAKGVSPPKIPSPSLSAHLHLSYPSKLCLSCIWSHRIIKLLPIHHLHFLFFLLQAPSPFQWVPPDFSSKDGQQLQLIAPTGTLSRPASDETLKPWRGPLLCPRAIPPGLELTWFELPRWAVLLPYFWILL